MTVAFSQAADKEFQAILKRYPQRGAALLPVLWLAQKELGPLSGEVRAYVAHRLDLPLARVEGVISFYTLYQTQPVGRYHIQVCRNLSCALRGCGELMQCLEEKLKIRPGEMTPDKMFSYSTVECLAACGGAPALMVNMDYYENMDRGSVETLLEKLRDGESSQ